MNSEKLLDDFDVLFAIAVNKIYIRKIVLALYARCTKLPSDVRCTHGFGDTLEALRAFPGSGLTH